MLAKALDAMAYHCSGGPLVPGACITDHSDGERGGFAATWPKAYHAQCWPHISRKMWAGTLGKTYRRNKQWETLDDQDKNNEEQSNRRKDVLHLPKDHPHFTQIIMHLSCLHRCQSEKMR